MLSDNIRNYRKENNMSQDELAEKLGVSRQSVSLWETGQTQPTIDNIIALSKIFNVSSDDILKESDSTYSLNEKMTEENKKVRPWIIASAVISVAVIVGGIMLFVITKNEKLKKDVDSSAVSGCSVSQSEISSISSEKKDIESKTVNESTGSEKNNTSKSVQKSTSEDTADYNAESDVSSASEATEQFDLFSYCKEFAIKNGNLNGDYTIYQQPASKYGGYDNEYFSISYWGDSNMVEFCLHCPLDETYSINFISV